MKGKKYMKGSSTLFHFSDFDSQDSSDDDGLCSFHPSLSLRNCTAADDMDFVKFVDEQGEISLVREVDETIKPHFENILRLVGGLNARLSQLESKTKQLENSVHNLKFSAEYIHARTDRKLRQLESTFKEVQDGIYFIRDKQEITEAKLQLAKLQDSNIATSSNYNMPELPTDPTLQPPLLISKQSPQPLPNPSLFSPNLPTTLLDSQIPIYQNTIPQKQFITTSQHYEPLPHFPYISPPPQQHLSLDTNNFQNKPQWEFFLEETPHIQPYTTEPPIHQFHGHTLQFEKPELEFSFGPGATKFVHNSQITNPSQSGDGCNHYEQVQKVEKLPHALPTALFLDSGSGSGGIEKKGSIDDVVAKVTAMGFRRDIVRAMVKKLTDNGHAVDLNMVLDKLMIR